MKTIIFLLLISINGFAQDWHRAKDNIAVKDTVKLSKDFEALGDTVYIIGTNLQLIFSKEGDSMWLYKARGTVLDGNASGTPSWDGWGFWPMEDIHGEVMYWQHDTPEIKCEGLIKGKRIEFDYDKDDATPMNGYLYLGSTKVIYYAGVKNVWPKPHYLFKKLYR